ncbi:MAG: hypothetical protein IT367_18395 [Candidatus Hydrogenedentes bacterium]|nr:hypothetical protein [Candidatus Hydrogenedentota bacterium]
MRKRYLFSGVEHFAFYDFHSEHGHVDENVYAYSNRAGGERSLVFYNNAYNTTAGWIKQSTGLNQGRGDEGNIISKSLADSLGLRREDNVYYAFRDHREGLEYIRHSRQLCDEGMFVHLSAYGWHAFIDWREVLDTDGSWGDLAWRLEGRGVGSLDYERRRRELAPLLDAFRAYFSVARVKSLIESLEGKSKAPAAVEESVAPLDGLLKAFKPYASISDSAADLAKFCGQALVHWRREQDLARPHVDNELAEEREINRWAVPVAYALLKPVSVALARGGDLHDGAGWLDAWLMTQDVVAVLSEILGDSWHGDISTKLLRSALRFAEHPLHRIEAPPSLIAQFEHILDDADVQQYLQFNEHEGTVYLNREQLERLLQAFTDIREPALEHIQHAEAKAVALQSEREACSAILAAADSCGYRVEGLREFVDSNLTDTNV